MDAVLDEAVTLASHLLESSGEFYPFGVVLEPGGMIRHVQVYSGETPSVEDVRAQLVAGLREGAGRQEFCAVGIVRNVRVTDTRTHLVRDAISVALEHLDGYAVQCFVPYDLAEDGSCEIGEPRATAGERAVFGLRDGS